MEQFLKSNRDNTDHVSPEDDAANAGVDQLDGPAGGEEGRDETEDDEADEDGEEDSAHRREVDLGLEGEDGEAQRDGSTGAHGHHHLNKQIVEILLIRRYWLTTQIEIRELLDAWLYSPSSNHFFSQILVDDLGGENLKQTLFFPKFYPPKKLIFSQTYS